MRASLPVINYLYDYEYELWSINFNKIDKVKVVYTFFVSDFECVSVFNVTSTYQVKFSVHNLVLKALWSLSNLTIVPVTASATVPVSLLPYTTKYLTNH